VEPQITSDGLLMLGDRRLPFAVEFDQPWIKPQLRRAEANQFLEELERLLLWEAPQEPHEGRLGRQSEAGYEGVDTCRAARNLRR
jgi:hypothetical protein